MTLLALTYLTLSTIQGSGRSDKSIIDSEKLSTSITEAKAVACNNGMCDYLYITIIVQNKTGDLYCVPGYLDPASLDSPAPGSVIIYNRITGKKYNQVSQHDYKFNYWGDDVVDRVNDAKKYPQVVLQPNSSMEIKIPLMRDFHFPINTSSVKVNFVSYPCLDGLNWKLNIYRKILDSNITYQRN